MKSLIERIVIVRYLSDRSDGFEHWRGGRIEIILGHRVVLTFGIRTMSGWAEMAQHTTRIQVSNAAGILAKRLGYSAYALQGGSKSNGVSWHVTFYRGDPAVTKPDRTVRLGMTASEAFIILRLMTDGIDLYLATQKGI